MKRAIAYKRGGQLFLHAVSKTTAGVWVLDPPVLSIGSADASQLGQCVVDVLQGSNTNVAHPTNWKGVFDPVLKLAGVKTWATFVKGARCVEVECEANRVSFIPTKNLGPGTKGGFEPLDTRTPSIPVTETVHLGNGLLAALEKAG